MGVTTAESWSKTTTLTLIKSVVQIMFASNVNYICINKLDHHKPPHITFDYVMTFDLMNSGSIIILTLKWKTMLASSGIITHLHGWWHRSASPINIIRDISSISHSSASDHGNGSPGRPSLFIISSRVSGQRGSTGASHHACYTHPWNQID